MALVEDKANLKRGIDRVNRGWTKKEYYDGGFKYCLIGSVCYNYGVWFNSPFLTNIIADEIKKLFPNRLASNPHRTVVYFNDHKDTTKEDVLLVMKHALERLEDER